MFAFPTNELPIIKKEYSIIRHSVWQAIDPNHIIVYIKEGRCIFEISNKEYIASPGDCVFIPKNTIYTRYPYEKELCTMVGIHFSMNGYEVTEQEMKNEIFRIKSEDLSSHLILNTEIYNFEYFYIHTLTHLNSKKEIIDKMLDMISSIRPMLSFYSSIPFSSFLIDLLALLSAESVSLLADKNTQDTSLPVTLRKAIFYIQQNYYKQITLDDLCKFCFVSKIQLNRLFNTYLNITPINYIITYRLNKAKDLLQNCEEMSVKEISTQVGYEDQCYFARLFKKFMGVSPMQFRTRTLSFNEKEHIKEISNADDNP
jgi:AraC-like DNA-binding protein